MTDKLLCPVCGNELRCARVSYCFADVVMCQNANCDLFQYWYPRPVFDKMVLQQKKLTKAVSVIVSAEHALRQRGMDAPADEFARHLQDIEATA